jgi:hypothetical protein
MLLLVHVLLTLILLFFIFVQQQQQQEEQAAFYLLSPASTLFSCRLDPIPREQRRGMYSQQLQSGQMCS